MNVTIEIHYISNGTKVLQRGSFPLHRKTHAQVAFDFLKEIKRKMPFGVELVKAVAAGVDITDKVKELEKAPLD